MLICGVVRSLASELDGASRACQCHCELVCDDRKILDNLIRDGLDLLERLCCNGRWAHRCIVFCEGKGFTVVFNFIFLDRG